MSLWKIDFQVNFSYQIILASCRESISTSILLTLILKISIGFKKIDVQVDLFVSVSQLLQKIDFQVDFLIPISLSQSIYKSMLVISLIKISKILTFLPLNRFSNRCFKHSRYGDFIKSISQSIVIINVELQKRINRCRSRLILRYFYIL